MIYIYDPKTNLSSPTTYEELAELTGKSIPNLQSSKSRLRKISGIDCYIADDKTSLATRRAWYSKESYKDEYWKIIEGSDDIFKVSNYGRVKRVFKNGKERFLLPFQNKGVGNLFVKTRWNGKYGAHKVGHIVAAHFIREKKPGESLARKNGIITDDHASNLTYMTKSELGKRTGFKGKSKPVVLLDPETKEILEEFRSAREAGRKLHFSYQAVLDRCNKKYPYRNDSYIFMFADEYEESK